jgi:hypothetical protein
VFKSTNGGGSWSPASTGLTTIDLRALEIDPATPTILYAGTGDGVFKSTNGGGSWSAVNTGLTNLYAQALAIDPTTPTTLYAGTYGGGVFKSTSAGGSWSPVNTGLTSATVNALAIDPTTPSTLYAGTYGGGVFKSTNGGGNWVVFSTGLTNPDVRALAIDPATPTTLYAGTYGSGVFSYSEALPPELTLNFTTGAPGSFFAASGTGFPANTTADVTVNGVALGVVSTDENGDCSFILSTANADEGSYTVTVSANPTASARFTLDWDDPVRPQEGAGPILDVPEGIAFTDCVFLPIVMR